MVTEQSQKPTPQCCGNPIFPGTGNKREETTDYVGVGITPLTFARIYNSAAQYGQKWQTNYDRTITISGNTATLNRPDGRYTFTWSGSAWVTDSDVNYRLTGSSGAFAVTSPDRKERESYDGYNHLQSISNPSGVPKYTIFYDVATSSMVTKVQDEFGHALNMTYDAQNRLATMTNPKGGIYQYGYDANNNLTTVTYPDGKTLTYVYGELSLTGGVSQPKLLTGIIDENNSRYANFGYSASGLAILTEHAGGVDRFAVTYVTPPSVQESSYIDVPNHVKYITRYYQAPSGTSIADGAGTARSYTYATVNGMVQPTGANSTCLAPLCSQIPKAQTLDANGNVTSKTDFNNNITNYTFDMSRNLETSRTEAYGTPRARTITTTWDPTFRQRWLG